MKGWIVDSGYSAESVGSKELKHFKDIHGVIGVSDRLPVVRAVFFAFQFPGVCEGTEGRKILV